MIQASSFSNILCAFAFIKIMYFECRNKQFEEEEKTQFSHRWVGRKIIIKVNFISRQQVPAVVSWFVKQIVKKQWPKKTIIIVKAILEQYKPNVDLLL